ncbi:MAG: protocatechuate 3,4-dioxygenase subunit alpha [Gammaproteobacteria bacterium]|nr:protocatechuate 3,4-dioxygenase subunit alpha [Gammaproteobacteria bacterium]
MAGKPIHRGQTPSQTVGPFYALGLTPRESGYEYSSLFGASTIRTETRGERIRIVGRVLDGEGTPIDDAMIELWQADADGRYRHAAGSSEDPRRPDPTFSGFARAGTGITPDRSFVFRTIKPGGAADGQAPHVILMIFMRGGLNHLYTRLYFADEAAANGSDPVLSAVPEERRPTLIAQREETADGVVYRFDIHMQGAHETVFFDV